MSHHTNRVGYESPTEITNLKPKPSYDASASSASELNRVFAATIKEAVKDAMEQTTADISQIALNNSADIQSIYDAITSLHFDSNDKFDSSHQQRQKSQKDILSQLKYIATVQQTNHKAQQKYQKAQSKSMKELKTQMDSLSLSVRDLKSEKNISLRKIIAVSRESQHSIPIENDDRTWEQRIEDPKEYSEEYAATILSEMMKDCDDSLIAQFIQKYTSIGGAFSHNLIVSYKKRLNSNPEDKNALMQEFKFVCAPIFVFNKWAIPSDFAWTKPSIDAVIDFLLNGQKQIEPQADNFLLRCLSLSDPLLHAVAPKLLALIDRMSSLSFDASVLVKRLLLWGETVIGSFVSQGDLDHILIQSDLPLILLFTIEKKKCILLENQWQLMEWLFFGNREPEARFYTITHLAVFVKQFYSLSAMATEGSRSELIPRIHRLLIEAKKHAWKFVELRDRFSQWFSHEKELIGESLPIIVRTDHTYQQKDEEFRRQQQNEYKHHWKELRERGQETKAHHCVASKDKGDKSINFQDLETILKHMISQSKSLYCSDEDTFKDMCEQFGKEFDLAKGMQSLDLKKFESHLEQIWQDASSVLSITNAKQLEEYGEELQNAMYAVIASVEEDGSTPISEVKQLKRLLDAIQTATGLISGMNEEDY